MTTCQACAGALRDPNSGRYDTECKRCRARYLSTLPRHIREQRVAEILLAEGAQVVQQLQLDIQDEFVRRQSLRRAPTRP